MPIEGTSLEMEQTDDLEAEQGHASSSKGASSSRAQEHQEEDELTRIEEELRDKIDVELDPLINECMLWELRILHSANITYLKHGDATADYHQPTLPLPLLKQEVIHSRKQFLPDIPQEEIGGYETITMEQWVNPMQLPNQPQWRLLWFRKYPNSKMYYMRAPRELRIDPTFCPVRRRRI